MGAKKGAVELQFNWIFVLIAGALILSLVVGFVFRWMHQSEKQDAIETMRNLETIITASGVVEGESKQIDMYGLSMTYDGLTLNFKGVGIPGWRMRSLFSPPKLIGEKMIIWTDSWFMPFYVGNLVYITTEQARYIAIYNTSMKSNYLERTLKELIPAGVNIDYIDEAAYGSITSQNNYYTVLVFLETSQAAPKPFIDKSIVVQMNPNNSSGTIEFFERSGSVWNSVGSSVWIQPEMLVGAVVTGDPGLYNSTFDAHLERLDIVSGLLLEKIRKLKMNFPHETSYLTFETKLQELQQNSASGQWVDIISEVRNLERLNKILALEGSPQVY